MSLTTDEKRAELLRKEIEEVWPSKDYLAMCESEDEQPWASEAEIRAYFSPEEMPDEEVIALWTDSPGPDEEQMARFLAAWPDGWTCQDCSKEYLPEGDQYPFMPAESEGGDGTVCPPGHGCKRAQTSNAERARRLNNSGWCPYQVTVRAPIEVLLAAHDEILCHIAIGVGGPALDSRGIDFHMTYEGDSQTPGDTMAETEYRAGLKECDSGAAINAELLGMGCFDGVRAVWNNLDRLERWTLAFGALNEEVQA